MNKLSGLTLTLTLALSGALTACGSDEKPPVASEPTTVTGTKTPAAGDATSDADATAPADGWVRTTDAGGVSFELPEEVEPQESTQPAADGNTVTRRLYQVGDDDKMIGVGVAEGMDLSTYDAAATLSQMASQLEQQGVKDLDTSGPTPTTFGDHEGVRTTLSFTALDGVRTHLLMAAITVGDLLVMVQGAASEISGVDVDEVERSFTRTAGSVRAG